jgi:hypothetical protein
MEQMYRQNEFPESFILCWLAGRIIALVYVGSRLADKHWVVSGIEFDTGCNIARCKYF